MGLTRVRLAIYSVDNPSASTEVDLLVDTGSILTWIPQKLLASLEIKPRRRGRLKTIHGQMVERDIGITGVKYAGQEVIVEIVFATDSDARVLGVTTLESLGYRVNPITEELEYVGPIAIPSQVVDPFEAEKDAFQDMRQKLLSNQKYRGKSVAVLNGSVVDFDADKVALVKRAYEKYGYAPIYVDKVDQERRHAEIPSPELRRK